jgi:hypothetical protein
MFRPIRLLLYMVSLGFLMLGFWTFAIGLGNGQWFIGIIFWIISAFVAWLGRKCKF